jgi:two-component sensor histidine kinase
MEHFAIPEDHIKKWQDILNLTATLARIPAALIMRVVDEDIEVFLASDNPDNPYKVGSKEVLADSGLYCETTIKNNARLLVPNALLDPLWESNPDIALNMISYLGLPILNPDDSPFGTLCILDSKQNGYSDTVTELLQCFKAALEADIALIKKNALLETVLKEVHHRIKNNIFSIESLLTIQLGKASGTEAKVALQEAIGRVQHIGIAYQKLLEGAGYAQLSTRNYLSDLVSSVVEIFDTGRKVTLHLDIEDVAMETSKLINIGLIVNEIVTNSLKYACPGTKACEIGIRFRKQGENHELSVWDNGAGIKLADDGAHPRGFGFTIMEALVQQIGGRMKLAVNGGTVVSISWKDSPAR